MNDQNYFKVNRIVNTDKIRFLEEFSDIERQVMRIMFLQLKIDILSVDNSGITTDVNKKRSREATRNLG